MDKSHFRSLLARLDELLIKAIQMENDYAFLLDQVHPAYRNSAVNMLHYLALRSMHTKKTHDQLKELGLSGLTNIEGHVMYSLLRLSDAIKNIVIADIQQSDNYQLTIKESKKQLNDNTNTLFGPKPSKRRTRIMVTLPEQHDDPALMIGKLYRAGMDCARINCAHGDKQSWKILIDAVKTQTYGRKRPCKIAMDLAGPKIRTGEMQQGEQVVHIKPYRNNLGMVEKPATVLIAPPDAILPKKQADAVVPVDEFFIKTIKRGDSIEFTDSRGKHCKIIIIRKQGHVRWGISNQSAFLKSGTPLRITTPQGLQTAKVSYILPIQNAITLFQGDQIRLHASPEPGEAEQRDEHGNIIRIAHIACASPEVLKQVKPKQSVFFDDGQIGGIVEHATEQELIIRITLAKTNGSKLKAHKGINFPDTELKLSGLTNKDEDDIGFVVKHADIVSMSFVNNTDDVKKLYSSLENLQTDPAIILKIETRQGFRNLPLILLVAMQRAPVGIMIARGDLAVETGWKDFAGIQQEIMWLCKAAHIPVVWATQVLENLTKKGTPSRAEITDAALAQQTECMMLNKGAYQVRAVKMLNSILRRMQYHNKKKKTVPVDIPQADLLMLPHI